MARVQRLHHDLDWAMRAVRTHRAVLVLDLAGQIVAVNQCYLQLCGYRREELVGHSVLLVLDHQEKTPGRLCRILEAGDGDGARILDLAQVTKAGRRFRTDAQLCPIRDDQGQVCLNVLFLQDSTAGEGPLRASVPALEQAKGQIIQLPGRYPGLACPGAGGVPWRGGAASCRPSPGDGSARG